MVKTFVVAYFSALVLKSHHSCCSNIIYWVPFKIVLVVCDTLMQANFSYRFRQTLNGALFTVHIIIKKSVGLKYEYYVTLLLVTCNLGDN